MDIEREGALLAQRMAVAKADAHARRLETFFAGLRRVLARAQCDDDLDLEELAPLLDEMRALSRAGCLMGLSPENRAALFTRFAPITALGAGDD